MQVYVYIYLNTGFIPAGKLLFHDAGAESGSVFAYGREYLQRKDAIAIDPIELPLSKREYQTKLGFKIFNVIRDAGPDKWGRFLIEKRFGRSLSELEYVLANSSHRAGALAFGPDLSGPKQLGPNGFETYETVSLDLAAYIQSSEDAIANSDIKNLQDFLKYGPSLGGARPKTTVDWQGRPYIAKFSTSLDRRNEPLIEYASMKLARQIGLDVPALGLAKVSKKEVYLIERFDRIAKNSKVHPIGLISGLTATEMHETDYANWSYAALCQAILKISSHPTEDRLELFKRMVFNILVNNDDDHLRNHSFVHTGNNQWRLSKLYDVVPRDQLSNTFRLALQIGEYGKEASQRNAISSARQFGLTTDQASNIWNELTDKVESNWKKTFLSAGLREQTVESFKDSIGARQKIIKE